MTILTFNDDSLRRGNVTRDEVIEVLDDPIVIEAVEGESVQGNPTIMYVGKTQKERLLEIGVEYKEHENCVYHARRANSKFKALYESQ